MLEKTSDQAPEWLYGRGPRPQLKWHFRPQHSCQHLCYSREAGDLFLGDETGRVTRLNSLGTPACLVELNDSIAGLSWADDGSRGAAIVGESTVLRLTQDLQVEQKLTFRDVCLGAAVSPFGNHLAVSLASGVTQIFSDGKRRIAQFESARPLAFLKFCPTEAILFGAAEHGLVCCHNLAGAPLWQKTTWSNVGQMAVTSDGDLLYLAGFLHGIQAMDGEGAPLGSYVLDGTVKRVDSSFEPRRLVASTVERSLFWLNSTGELIWQGTLSDDITGVICDPLGAWAICSLARDGVYRLDWNE